jgi:hypothetical protein
LCDVIKDRELAGLGIMSSEEKANAGEAKAPDSEYLAALREIFAEAEGRS